MDGSVFEKKCFKMLGLYFSSKLGQGSYIVFIDKKYLQENWELDSLYEVFFFWGWSLSL